MYGRAYDEVQDFVKRLGGTMVWRAGGHGGGGDWVLHLHGRTAIAGIHSREVGPLDDLYVVKPGAKTPVRWDEDAWLPTLADDAFWILVSSRFDWQPPCAVENVTTQINRC